MTRDAAVPVASSPRLAVTSLAVPDRPLSSKAREWNTKSLGLRLGADAASAAMAGALVCPTITIIDR